jgi:hypothetical protein
MNLADILCLTCDSGRVVENDDCDDIFGVGIKATVEERTDSTVQNNKWKGLNW